MQESIRLKELAEAEALRIKTEIKAESLRLKKIAEQEALRIKNEIEAKALAVALEVKRQAEIARLIAEENARRIAENAKRILDEEIRMKLEAEARMVIEKARLLALKVKAEAEAKALEIARLADISRKEAERLVKEADQVARVAESKTNKVLVEEIIGGIENRLKTNIEKKLVDGVSRGKFLLDKIKKPVDDSIRTLKEFPKQVTVEFKNKIEKPIDEGIQKIKEIPKLITVDLKDKITKDLPAVLIPVALNILKDMMPKPKGTQEADELMEYGIYLNDDGTYCEMDERGFHPYIPKDPIYTQDEFGVWWITDKNGGRRYEFPDPKYYQDSDGNYWVDYGDGKGRVPYSPEMERLANGFYQDEMEIIGNKVMRV